MSTTAKTTNTENVLDLTVAAVRIRTIRVINPKFNPNDKDETKEYFTKNVVRITFNETFKSFKQNGNTQLFDIETEEHTLEMPFGVFKAKLASYYDGLSDFVSAPINILVNPKYLERVLALSEEEQLSLVYNNLLKGQTIKLRNELKVAGVDEDSNGLPLTRDMWMKEIEGIELNAVAKAYLAKVNTVLNDLFAI